MIDSASTVFSFEKRCPYASAKAYLPLVDRTAVAVPAGGGDAGRGRPVRARGTEAAEYIGCNY